MNDQKTNAGHQELPHTADWALLVWAPDLLSLLEEAARGMYALQGVHLSPGKSTSRTFEVSGQDPESLLVAFLTELLFLAEQEELAFTQFDLTSKSEDRLEAAVLGGEIEAQDKEIKAVTYHNLEIRSQNGGLEVEIVFDV